jgi:hypothetical protein
MAWTGCLDCNSKNDEGQTAWATHFLTQGRTKDIVQPGLLKGEKMGTAATQQYLGRQHSFPFHLLFDYMVEKMVAEKIATYEMAAPFRKTIPNRPFLWIPSGLSILGLGRLMDLVTAKGIRGVNFLSLQYCSNTVAIPAEPYFMFDIEDGGDRLDVKPSLSEASILSEGRSPYTIIEGIVHAMVFPEVFDTHNMSLCGSRYKLENIPELLLGDSGPRLQSSFTDSPHPRWGTPSCRGRYTAHE